MTLFIVFAAMTIALVVMGLRLGEAEPVSPVDVKVAALDWVGEGHPQSPRHDGDRWEVDVVRRDGSMVQVNLGEDLRLQGFDEERGPAGGPAHDEVTGAARASAVRAALAEVGPGYVVGVERDSFSEIEVGIRKGKDRQIEVELDERFRVTDVSTEDPGDE
jgi:hypothetical protein